MPDLNWLALIAAAIAQAPDPISGGAGWVGAGLLGLVLGWLLLVHLPAKDKQLKELIGVGNIERESLIERYDAERERERAARHERANQFQVAMNKLADGYETAMEKLQAQHRVDADADRAAFLSRNDQLREAIRTQTTELKLAFAEIVKGVCQANQHVRSHQ